MKTKIMLTVLALGASAFDVRRHVMKQTVILVSGGIAIGIVGALISGQLMASLLYRMQPTDPATLAGTAFVLLAIALLAAYLPALRASRVDPMSALRTE